MVLHVGTGGVRCHAAVRPGLRPRRFRWFPRPDGGHLDQQVMRLHVGVHVSDATLECIRSQVPDVCLTYHPYTPYESAIDQQRFVADAEVILGYHADFSMDRAPRLRWLHSAADGVDYLRGMPI